MAKTEFGKLEGDSPRQNRQALKLYLKKRLADLSAASENARHAYTLAQCAFQDYLKSEELLEDSNLPREVIDLVRRKSLPSMRQRDACRETWRQTKAALEAAQRLYDNEFPPWYARFARWLMSPPDNPPNSPTIDL